MQLPFPYQEQIAYIMMWELEKGTFSTTARVGWAIKQRFRSRVFFTLLYFHAAAVFIIRFTVIHFLFQFTTTQTRRSRSKKEKKNCLTFGKSIFPDLISLSLFCVAVFAPYFHEYWKSIFCGASHVLQHVGIVNSSCVFFSPGSCSSSFNIKNPSYLST